MCNETPEWVMDLVERETHSDTMRALTPLERQWLADWRAFFEPKDWRTSEDAKKAGIPLED